MLIHSNRHTVQDLEAWKEYEELDSISVYSQKKVDQSLVVMECFLLSDEKSCIMTSWGKDSVVMMHLFQRLGIKRPVVYMRFSDRSNPDVDLVRDSFLSQFAGMDYREETFNYSEARKGDKHWKILHEKYGKRVTGIRNDESSTRCLQWHLNGFESKNSCRPLSLWKNSEVFAYIHAHKLPLCPVYGYLGGGRYKRENLRTHSLAGTSGNGMGRTEWEREYYQDILNKVGKLF